MRLTKSTGTLLLGIWFILTGVIPLLNLSFSGLSLLMAILALAAGAVSVPGGRTVAHPLASCRRRS